MSSTRIGLIEGLQIDHPLIGGGGLVEASLLHQRVAEQSVVEDDGAPGDEIAGDVLRLLELVQLVEDVAAQQQGGRFTGMRDLQTGRNGFGQRVVTGVAGHSGARDVQITEPFERCSRIGPAPGVLPGLLDLRGKSVLSLRGCQRHGAPVRRGRRRVRAAPSASRTPRPRQQRTR